MTCNGGGQCSLFIVCVNLNANICCEWSSHCLENVWTTLICIVTYVENLQWKLKDTVLLLWLKRPTNYTLAAKSGTKDKPWAPHICCGTCASNFRKWLHGSWPSVSFAVPMVWREQKDHITDLFLFDQCERILCKSQAWYSVPKFALSNTASPSGRFPHSKAPKWLEHWWWRCRQLLRQQAWSYNQ